jgi:hypothetical protein
MSAKDGEIKRVLGEAEALLGRLREEGERDGENSGGAGMEEKYVLSPRFLGIVSLAVAIAAVTTLTIVVAVRQADGLATIALVLAILAFVIQILVFIAQAQTSSQQMLQSERLNTQTRSLLSEIQATARSTQGMMREHVSELIKALIDANGGKGLAAADIEALRGLARAGITSEQSSRTEVSEDIRDLEFSLREMFLEGSYDAGPYPSREDAEPVLEALRKLSGSAKRRLSSFAADKHKIETETESGIVGYPPSETVAAEDKELLEAGFIRPVVLAPEEQAFFAGDSFIYRLTEDGVLAGRILNATGEVPVWAMPILGPPEGE